jgi:hypothetical protein
MQGCQPIFHISPGSQMLQKHGPPKKRNQTGAWIVDPMAVGGSADTNWEVHPTMKPVGQVTEETCCNW